MFRVPTALKVIREQPQTARARPGERGLGVRRQIGSQVEVERLVHPTASQRSVGRQALGIETRGLNRAVRLRFLQRLRSRSWRRRSRSDAGSVSRFPCGLDAMRGDGLLEMIVERRRARRSWCSPGQIDGQLLYLAGLLGQCRSLWTRCSSVSLSDCRAAISKSASGHRCLERFVNVG